MRNTFIRHALAASLSLIFAGAAAALPQTQNGPDYGYAAPAAGPAATADSELMHGDTAVDFDGVNLQPGEFVWLPGSQVRSGTPVTFLVSLRDQRGYLYRDGQRIAVTTVSTGKPGYDTPTGVFPIMEKKKVHHSNRYEGSDGRPAPMPYMQRLTMYGVALHQGRVMPGPASHGCVRLPAEFAKQLFSLTQRGDIVLISEDTSLGSLARAGADEQVGLLVGATGSLNVLADRMMVSGQQDSRIESSATVRNTAF
jgi:lipoprotein-anchoring transpeptidase ErfK/SrfK